MEKSIAAAERYETGALLAAAGGFLDAYTYLGRGHVFANAQTGNMVLMGMHLFAGKWRESVVYAIPIFAFFLGVYIAEIFKSRFRNNRLHWQQAVLLIEMAVIAGVAFLPAAEYDQPANILVSFVCALQVESFRRVNGQAFATTMCTGNLRSATELLYLYRTGRDRENLKKSLQYFGIILFFIIGAASGGLLTGLLGIYAVLIALPFLGAALFLMHKGETGR